MLVMVQFISDSLLAYKMLENEENLNRTLFRGVWRCFIVSITFSTRLWTVCLFPRVNCKGFCGMRWGAVSERLVGLSNFQPLICWACTQRSWAWLKPTLCCVFERVLPTCFTQWEESCSLLRIIPLGTGWVTLQKTRQTQRHGGGGLDVHLQDRWHWTVWSTRQLLQCVWCSLYSVSPFTSFFLFRLALCDIEV